MDKKDNLNAALDPAVVAKIAAHYRHARAKHPHFTDEMFIGEKGRTFAEEAKSRPEIWRMILTVGKPDAEAVLMCELAEAREAAARGDRAHAVEECYDVVAVLLRMIDVLEGRQALGDPAKEDAKTEGAMQ